MPKSKGKEGGWVATFAGVPAFVVNTDVVKNVPQTWADLIKPEYTVMTNALDPTKSGTDGTTFIAWAYAHGGDENNLDAAVDFAKQIIGQFSAAASNTQTLEKGEVPIQIKYDFNCAAATANVQEKGVNAQVIIPSRRPLCGQWRWGSAVGY
jgi:putative spermidine/putrescine transport system substrate-binding protein